ncbi:MAG TPA: hypothetical protein VLE70_02200 [Anaerolineae bacterium]|jgi:hypothetical protein|nr:hypothetical protein [Anaerolineae bacterium]
MFETSPESSRPARRTPLPAVGLLSLVLLLLVACSGRNDEPAMLLGSEATLSGEAQLFCGDECRQRSQCGTIDSSWVVLISSAGPATSLHDLTFPADAAVTINSQQMTLVDSVSSPGSPWRQAFYLVSAPDRVLGWVAGWCIAQEIVP